MIWHLLVTRQSDGRAVGKCLMKASATGRAFKSALRYELISEDDLLQLIAEELGTEVVEVRTGEIDEELVDIMSTDITRTYGVIPINRPRIQ